MSNSQRLLCRRSVLTPLFLTSFVFIASVTAGASNRIRDDTGPKEESTPPAATRPRTVTTRMTEGTPASTPTALPKVFSTEYSDIFVQPPAIGGDTGSDAPGGNISPNPSDSSKASPGGGSGNQNSIGPKTDGKLVHLAGPPISSAPMTTGEKFHFYLVRTFKPPEPYALSIVAGLFTEATRDKGKPVGSFLADSMSDAARNFTFRATSNFFSHFAYASLFKQDPRFHRAEGLGKGALIKRSIARVFITQGDRNGQDEINYSFLLGNLTAAGLSNLWVQSQYVGVSATFIRFAESLGTKALRNLFDQMVKGQ